MRSGLLTLNEFSAFHSQRLLDVINIIGSRRVSDVMDAMLMLASVECIRAVMNNTQGLEFFIYDVGAAQQLITGACRQLLIR